MSAKTSNIGFIPAREKRWFIILFSFYVKWLFWRRFSHVLVSGQTELDLKRPVLFYANHFYWWDALIPFYLCRFELPLKPRAIMEDRQMRQFPFFSWIGAFSVNRENRKSAITTLRFAADWLTERGRCLFLFPNGAFTNPVLPIPAFEGGLSWLASRTEAPVHPIAFMIVHTGGNRPELRITIGPAQPKPDHPRWLDDRRAVLQELLISTAQPPVAHVSALQPGSPE